MLLSRRLELEWLDELPVGDARAIRSRRDLRLINRIMGHARIIAKALRPLVARESPRLAELGAGDGSLLLRVAADLKWRGGADVVLVDRQPAVSAETGEHYRDINCRVVIHAADVFEWLRRHSTRYDAIVANLFLHHFEDRQLAELLRLAAARTRVFIACEPRRARLALAGSHMLGLIGCNDVTRHDAVLSVRAGFSGRDLSDSWPQDGWILEERAAGRFSHLFIARCGDK